jgi:phosphate transport system substrate-binding protein
MKLRRTGRVTSILLAVVVAAIVAACGSSSDDSTTSAAAGSGTDSAAAGGTGGGSASGTLNGSGSSFQLAYQQAAIEAYKGINPNLTVNYGGGGSGKGRTDLAGGVVDYAGSDSPIKAEDLPTFKGGTVLYFPVVVGPITASYNLSGVDQQLQLDGTVLANIFQGKITKWNDPAIAAQNSGVELPDTAIVIARRSDSSGTTDNFSQFLDKSSGGAWTLGTGSTINFPANSQGGNGNGGVAQLVKQTDGAIGYVDFADAQAAGLKWAKIKNQAGTYIDPSPDAATAAAAAATVNPDLTFSAIWTNAPDGYPITYQSYVLVYEKQSAADKAAALQAWVGYLVGDGQKLLPDLGYGSVPPSILSQAQAQITKIAA